MTSAINLKNLYVSDPQYRILLNKNNSYKTYCDAFVYPTKANGTAVIMEYKIIENKN